MAHSEHQPHRGLAQTRSENYQQWADRPTPQWFKKDKLGIFIHWGPYSVPAFAETLGDMGFIDPKIVHAHNPYSEWYYNTIRYPEGEAAKYHKKNYGDAPYDDLIDMWKAKDFDADKLVKVFKKAGARFLVPVTKHHDGVALWDAPETGTRNTVHRGPKRDITGEWAKASEDNGLKFGVYYSTGIDWHYYPTEKPWGFGNWERPGLGAKDYNEYAWRHCADLIDRHKPYLLWGDIDWPKEGVAPGEYSVEALFTKLYKTNPEAVVNDRYGNTHWDFKTVEYGLGKEPEPGQMWQCARGIGSSFAYNKQETEKHYMSGQQAIRLLVDVCSRGGNLLLNVGPDEHGNVPDLQMKCLDYMGEYMSVNEDAVNDTEEVDKSIVQPTGAPDAEDGWVRWLRKGDRVFGFVDGQQSVKLSADEKRVNLASARLLSGEAVNVKDVRPSDCCHLRTSVRILESEKRCAHAAKFWNFILPFMFNPNAGNLEPRCAFAFGGTSILCCIYVWFSHPETKGRSFQEIDELFMKRVPARQFRRYVTEAELKARETRALDAKTELHDDA